MEKNSNTETWQSGDEWIIMKEPIFVDLDEMIPGNPIDTIHGCNADSQEYPEEIEECNKALEEWFNQEENQTLRDAFPGEYGELA